MSPGELVRQLLVIYVDEGKEATKVLGELLIADENAEQDELNRVANELTLGTPPASIAEDEPSVPEGMNLQERSYGVAP